MTRRRDFRPGDWVSVALRLDEIISAHSGEEPFDEAHKLLVAKLAHESGPGGGGPFLGGASGAAAAAAVDRLLREAGDRWPDLLDDGASTRLGGPALVRCAAALDSVRLLSDDLVGLDAIFEVIVARAAKGQKGQFFTPRHVIREVVEMVRPRPGERVADPACGSGGFLRHALRHAPGCLVWGFDQDPRAVRVARVLLAASGQPAARVQRVDSLRRPGGPPGGEPLLEELVRAREPSFAGFDVVLTNPPFAGDVGAAYAASYELGRHGRVERDALFVERCVELLRPGGRLGMVLPHSKVGGAAFAGLRRWLLERVQVVAVLGLGRNTFRPHTGQQACVVLGRKRVRPAPPHPDEEILFVVSERDGKDGRGRLARRGEAGAVDHDLGEATPLVRERFALLPGAGS